MLPPRKGNVLKINVQLFELAESADTSPAVATIDSGWSERLRESISILAGRSRIFAPGYNRPFYYVSSF